jgi:hypothetical protein
MADHGRSDISPVIHIYAQQKTSLSGIVKDRASSPTVGESFHRIAGR